MKAIKVLVLDDRRDVIEEVVTALSGFFEVTGAKVTTVEEAVEAAILTDPDAILLDIQLDGGTEGVEVADELLNRRCYKGLVVGHSNFSLKEQRRLLAPVGVKHFALKGSISILRCLAGTCSCEQPVRKSGEEAGGTDLLVAMRDAFNSQAIKRGMEDHFSCEAVGEGERAAEKIRDLKPKVVLYEAFERVTDGYSSIVHDWSHLRNQDPDLPELPDLDVSWVMVSWGQEESTAKERGHAFMRLPFRLAELREYLEKLLPR